MMMIGLRSCAALAMLAVACVAQAAPTVRQYRFRIYLDDTPVGYHRVRLEQDGTAVRVETDARFDVRVLSVPIFHYLHRATETWRDGCVESLDASTDDNGRHKAVEAVPRGRELEVTSTQTGEALLPGCVMTYAYWNPGILHVTHLLNAQTGEYQRVRITRLPEASITVHGAPVAAVRYRLDTGKHGIDLWYSRDGQWLALESAVALGKHLRFRLE